jgi:outer membrane protein assembly factor BamB
MVAEGEVGRQSWWKPFRATGPQAVADVDGDGRYEIGGVTVGQLYNWPAFYAVDGPDKEFLCYDALSGRLKWSYPLGVTSSGATAADLDGDGKLEFLLGTADGRLIALRGETNVEKRVLWELSFPAALGPPIVCDVEGDGAMSILVGCADGQLYCVR